MTALITATDLKKLLDSDKSFKILDATYPPVSGDGMGLPRAVMFDIDEVADLKNAMPHMLPSAEFFEQKVQKLGINKDDDIIVYDQQGIAMAAARAWWMFRCFGHTKIRILDGGRRQWEQAGFDLEPVKDAADKKGNFKAAFQAGLVKGASDVLKNIQTGKYQLLDVRNRARFDQEGHIPKSLNLFFMNFIDGQTATLRPAKDLQSEFDQARLDTNKPVILSCGSGVTACVGALALYELGIKDAAVYDGSWMEWSSRSDLPKEQVA